MNKTKVPYLMNCLLARVGILLLISFVFADLQLVAQDSTHTYHEVSTPYDDLSKQGPIQLKTPSNIHNSVSYNSDSSEYVFHKKTDAFDLEVPYGMTAAEYSDYSMKRSLQYYWNERNQQNQQDDGKGAVSNNWFLNNLNNTPFGHFNIFGGKGIHGSIQGSAELRFGVSRTHIDNPTISERLRTTTSFDFQDKIQTSITGSVGDYVNIGVNYNTNATFDFDNKVLLSYKGDEDDILQTLEAGNVSLPLQSSLIHGSQSLMGIKSTLKFGHLSIATVMSQQKAQSQTINLTGGAQQTEFTVDCDQYESDKHFFLSQYFRDTYEQSMQLLPFINSGVTITKIEVWITNREGNFNQSRNVLAFSDLAEPTKIYNNQWTPTGTLRIADNGSNTLYNDITKHYSGIRDANQISQVLAGIPSLHNSIDYEKVSSARMLSSSEYVLNPTLGYISLLRSLSSDEVLSVAYEYVYRGKTYRVGELTGNSVAAPNTLVTKLIRGSLMSPQMPFWNLMMKNVYAVGATQLASDNFQLYIQYKDDSTGASAVSLNVGNIQGKTLLSVMQLDNLDYFNTRHPDGFFDYVEGYTVNSQYGRIIFPVLEPFGSNLKKAIGSDPAGDKYIYQALYDSTLIQAQEQTEKNKFQLRGYYKSGSGSEIMLNAMNVPEGSVKVTAGGVPLIENVDYVVDYNLGRVKILNQSLLESGTPIKITLENQSMFSLQTKTMLGTHLEYAFNKNLSIGGTLMYLSEKPYTTKVNIGDEPVSNTMVGLNGSYYTESESMTDWMNAMPFLNLKGKSSLNAHAEVAELIPGHSAALGSSGSSYIDDFEATTTNVDLHNYFAWSMASTPEGQTDPGMFPEGELTNNLDYGKNRSRLAWYYIDPMFSRILPTTPGYIANSPDMRSNNLTREILSSEIWPNRDLAYGTPTAISTLNLAYYPSERGAYNYDAKPTAYSKGMGLDGKLVDPASRWGGIMRRIETSDFETNNIEYVEFWMMDPFVTEEASNTGGDLYFNLGSVSEDVLKDGYLFYENGMPSDGSLTGCDSTVWGMVPTQQGLVNAFDNTGNGRTAQDVGLDGLSNEREKNFFSEYMFDLQNYVPNYYFSALAQNDPHSPINDPSGDNYHYYRGSDYDRDQVSILDRYKYYNNPEGNSQVTGATGESYSTAATSTPNSEDINQDNTLNEAESYYQYKVELKKSKMVVGQNHIVDKVDSRVTLANGKQETVTWYQVRIPVQRPDLKVGKINDFKSIRFMRMFLKGFKENTFLRFATLDLVRADWRIYTKPLYAQNTTPIVSGNIDLAAVNIEENAARKPVNYILPPGVNRQLDPSQPKVNKVQMNEQSLSLKINELAPADARGVYKNAMTDLRRYKRLQMYWHAESQEGKDLSDNQLTGFIRIGTDNENNYYEYEVPLKVTPAGVYNPSLDREKVWPEQNFMNIDVSKLVNVKLNRNTARNRGDVNVSYSKLYTEVDPDHPANRITVVGNPSIGAIKTIMIGVRNHAREIRSAEVWTDELRVSDFDESGGWAGTANTSIRLADLGSVQASGSFQTAGFGSIDQKIQQRSTDNITQYSVATNLELGKLLPEKAKVQMPIYMSYSKAVSTPEYDPFSSDVKLSQTLNTYSKQSQRDSIKQLVQTQETRKSLNFSNVRVNIASKNPMPYDPANFSANYAYTEISSSDPTVEGAIQRTYDAGLSYDYAPSVKPFEPFKKSKSVVLKQPAFQLIHDFSFSYLPQSISYRVAVHRYYFQNQLRDFEGFRMDPQVRRQFYLDQMFNLQYSPLKTLQMNLSTTTNGIIDEPFEINGKNYIIDKNRYPTEYKVWKDSVLASFRHFGRPAQYSQSFSANYTFPFDKIPYMDWVTANGSYASTYSWFTAPQLGTDADNSGINPGNTIANLNAIQAEGRLNMMLLYNKSTYLKNVNNQYRGKSGSRNSDAATGTTREVRYEESVDFVANKPLTIKHKMGTTTIRARAYDDANRAFAVKIEPIDNNTSKITYSRTVSHARLVLIAEVDARSSPWEEAAKVALRILMGLRDVSVSYRENNSTTLTGFLPSTGFMGQDAVTNSPGYAFAFGAQKVDFGRRAMSYGWVADSASLNTPYMMTHMTDFTARASFEFFPDLKLDLNMGRTYSDSYSEYLQQDAPYYSLPYETGNISMTYLSLGSSFWKVGKSGNYNSETFDQFLTNRIEVGQRIATNKELSGARYPTTGDYAGLPYAGQAYHANYNANGTYNPTHTSGVNLNSPDVMIPAFLSAYSGKDGTSQSLNIIPSLAAMMPNWRLSYSGLANFSLFRKQFSSIILLHSYQSLYNVGSFTTNEDYSTYNDGFGFMTNASGGSDPGFVSNYYVPSVSITEAFNPLISIDVKMRNNFMFRSAINRSRNITLNIPSNQLLEGFNNETTVGIGYRINDFNMIVGWGTNTTKVRNDLTLKIDVSWNDMSTFIRRIDENYSAPSQGVQTTSMTFTADYILTQNINVRLFYDQVVKNQLISTFYNTSNTNFGISFRFTLTE